MNGSTNTWNHPDVCNLSHDVRDGEVGDHHLLPLHEIVGGHGASAGPGHVVLRQQRPLGVGRGAAGVADDARLVDGLALQPLRQLLVSET